MTDVMGSNVYGSCIIGQTATYYPRVVTNQYSQAVRYVTASPFGTGSSVITTPTNGNGIVNGQVQYISGSAGRCFTGISTTLTAGQWYSYSFEVVEMTGPTGATQVFYQAGGTAVITSGSATLTAANVISGGLGRYSLNFMSAAGGTFTSRFGVGLSANVASHTLTLRNHQYELVNSATETSEYVYPTYSAGFNSDASHISIDAVSRRVTYGTPVSRRLKPYTNIIAVGDSRSDELSDFPYQLNTILAGQGACNYHAHGGWTTLDIQSATLGAYSLTLAKALDGLLYARAFSTAGDEQYGDNQGSAFNTLLIGNLGVNDINGGASGATIMSRIDTICTAARSRGMSIIITNITPWSTSAAWSAPEQVVTEEYNAALQAYAAANGHLFVDLYTPMGEPGTPTALNALYSVDGLHPNAAGGLVCAQAILAALPI